MIRITRQSQFVYDSGADREFWGSSGSGVLFVRNHQLYGIQVLLTLRSAGVEEPGTWCVPGGAIGVGEDEFSSALREVQEEIGSVPPFRKMDQHVWSSGGSFKYTTFILECLDLTWVPGSLNWEVDDVIWVSVDEVKTMNLHFGLSDLLSSVF